MARPREHDGVVYRRNDSNVWWMRYRDGAGSRCLESTNTADWDEAQRVLRERLAARDNNSLDILRKGRQTVFKEWVDHFLEHYSKPPIRTKATHVANQAALRTLGPAFGTMKLADINPPMIEEHLRRRFGQRRVVHRKEGICELGILKPTTVHQEFRVLRRIFAVAVKKRLVTINPCSAVEFPVRVKGLFRPHYMTWSEQTKIETHAPEYLKNVIRIITETGLRVYKELASIRKEQIDLSNKVVFIADSNLSCSFSTSAAWTTAWRIASIRNCNRQSSVHGSRVIMSVGFPGLRAVSASAPVGKTCSPGSSSLKILASLSTGRPSLILFSTWWTTHPSPAEVSASDRER